MVQVSVSPHELRFQVGCMVVRIMSNVKFVNRVAFGRNGIARPVSSRVVDVQVIAPGALPVKVPRITKANTGAKGTTIRRQYFGLLRVACATLPQ